MVDAPPPPRRRLSDAYPVSLATWLNLARSALARVSFMPSLE